MGKASRAQARKGGGQRFESFQMLLASRLDFDYLIEKGDTGSSPVRSTNMGWLMEVYTSKSNNTFAFTYIPMKGSIKNGKRTT